MVRKTALQVGALALLAFMAWNAYLAGKHLKQMQKIAALTLESSIIHSDISAILKDLTEMETGQRGYLLTDDPSTCSPTPTRRAGSEPILPPFVQGGLIERSANDPWSHSSSLWLTQSKLRWSTLLVCANRGIATAHSCWWIQTKVWNIWTELAGFCLRYPWRRPATSRNSTKRGMLAQVRLWQKPLLSTHVCSY